VRLHPELEAYRDRLMDRCASWPEMEPHELLEDLQRSLRQVDLLEKALVDLRSRIEKAGGDNLQRLLHRASVQEQTRDLVKAYVEVLKQHLSTISS
jgi:hypothetical protein